MAVLIGVSGFCERVHQLVVCVRGQMRDATTSRAVISIDLSR